MINRWTTIKEERRWIEKIKNINLSSGYSRALPSYKGWTQSIRLYNILFLDSTIKHCCLFYYFLYFIIPKEIGAILQGYILEPILMTGIINWFILVPASIKYYGFILPLYQPSNFFVHGLIPNITWNCENERMTLMSVGTGLILLVVALITFIFRFKIMKNNK